MEDNYLTILWFFLPYINMNRSQVYMCPPTSWTPLPLPSPPYLSGLSQSTGFGCLAPCIELVLIIYFTYGNVHVLLLFSQIISPSLSPTEPKSFELLFLNCIEQCKKKCIIYIYHRYIIYIYLSYIYIWESDLHPSEVKIIQENILEHADMLPEDSDRLCLIPL